MPTDKQLANDHKYVTEHGRKPAPGVTTIIGMIDKPGLKWGSSEVAAKTALQVLRTRKFKKVVDQHRQVCMANPKKMVNNANGIKIRPQYATDDEIFIDYCRGEFDRQWKAKAALGSRVHDHALSWAQGKPVQVQADEMGYMDALERFLRDWRPRSILDEAIVLNPNPLGQSELEYGGRLDRVGEFDLPPWMGVRLMDFKTGAPGYIEDKALQAALYWCSEGVASYNDDGSLGKLIPLPDIDGAMTVYLGADGQYILDDPLAHITKEECFTAGMHLRAAWNSHKKIEAIEKELREE